MTEMELALEQVRRVAFREARAFVPEIITFMGMTPAQIAFLRDEWRGRYGNKPIPGGK